MRGSSARLQNVGDIAATILHAAALDAGRAAKEAAYKDHWQDLITAWKPAEERQAIAKTLADGAPALLWKSF